MMVRKPLRVMAFAVAALVLVAGRALAQSAEHPSAGGDPASTPATTDEGADVLRGPVVQEKPAARTLVVKDMSGKLEVLTTRPEQAAIDLLELTAQERAPIDALFVERAAAVTKLLREHQDLFLKIQAGRQGGAPQSELRPLMLELRGYALDLIDPPLRERVRELLPQGQRETFDALVNEYVKAATEAVAERQPEGGRAGERPRGVPGGKMKQQREEMGLLLREVARTLNGIVVQRREQMDGFLKAVDATPEQEAKLRAIARDAAAKDKEQNGAGGYGARDEDARREMWRKMMDVLTPAQRVKAIEHRLGKD